MHPGDQHHHDHQHRHQHQYERRRDLYGDEPDEERKSRDRSPDAWGAAATEPHRALLPLPLPSAHSIHSIHYDRRRAELFPSEHKTSPPGAGHFSPNPHQRHQDFPLRTVFPTYPLGQERRHHQHFQYHIDTQHRDALPHRRERYSPAEAKQTATPSRSGKASLAFILDNNEGEQDGGDDDEADSDQHMDAERSLTYLHLNDTSSRDDNDGDSSDTSLERYASYSHSGSERRSPPAAREGGRKGSIKKSRICKVENCTRYVVNKGLCIGHGGGKRCAVAGCTSSAKNMGVCWKHGGSTKCTVDNCENRAKSRGVCWSHGGGRKCKEDGCSKTAVSNGLCWAHGGGKRCIVDGCKKPAYERNGNLCTLHKSGTHAPSA